MIALTKGCATTLDRQGCLFETRQMRCTYREQKELLLDPPTPLTLEKLIIPAGMPRLSSLTPIPHLAHRWIIFLLKIF